MNAETTRAEKLADMKPPLEDQGRILWELIAGYEVGQIFLNAFDLGIFKYLKEPKSLAQLASELNLHPQATEKFLDVLVSLGLLARNGGGYLTAPKMAPFLVEGEPHYARYLNFANEAKDKWSDLQKILRNGPVSVKNEHEHKYDRETIDWIARGAMLGRLQYTIQLIREFPEFKAARKLIDLGGGHGLFGIGFAQENPDLDVVIFDRPDVAEIAQDYINQYGIGSRVRAIGGDYTKDDLGSGYDIAFEACSFGGDAEQAVSYYQNVADCLNTGGLFVAQTFTIDDDKKAPLRSMIWDLKEQITGDGHMHLRTNSELFGILRQAGLKGEKVLDLSSSMPMPMRLVVARKE
ncbi:MAG: Methyltransferase domain protein [Methanosaeta sp. PtaU1.Bin112]|nr:MAG: Methyltransferase domain protein [Methanosaeta sp. PtaU1.Bin112]